MACPASLVRIAYAQQMNWQNHMSLFRLKLNFQKQKNVLGENKFSPLPLHHGKARYIFYTSAKWWYSALAPDFQLINS
jgi:hypothetical protein